MMRLCYVQLTISSLSRKPPEWLGGYICGRAPTTIRPSSAMQSHSSVSFDELGAWQKYDAVKTVATYATLKSEQAKRTQDRRAGVNRGVNLLDRFIARPTVSIAGNFRDVKIKAAEGNIFRLWRSCNQHRALCYMVQARRVPVCCKWPANHPDKAIEGLTPSLIGLPGDLLEIQPTEESRGPRYLMMHRKAGRALPPPRSRPQSRIKVRLGVGSRWCWLLLQGDGFSTG